MPSGAATTSETRVGKKISQRSSGAFCSSVQLYQLWKYRERPPQSGPQNPDAAEAAVQSPHSIKFQRKSFVACVGDDANGIKRNLPLLGPRSHGGGLHLDRVRAGFVAQFFLFGNGRGDAVGEEKFCRLCAGGNQFVVAADVNRL